MMGAGWFLLGVAAAGIGWSIWFLFEDPRRFWAGVGVGLGAVVLCFGAIDRADAAEEAPVYDVEVFEQQCEELTPADQEYREIVVLANGCAVLVERFDHLAQVLQDRLDRQLAVVEAEGPVQVEVANDDPVAVAEAEPIDVEALEPAISASGAATKEAVWALAGLLVGLFACYMFGRQWLSRA